MFQIYQYVDYLLATIDAHSLIIAVSKASLNCVRLHQIAAPTCDAMSKRRPESGLKHARVHIFGARWLGQAGLALALHTNQQPSVTPPINAHHLAAPTDSCEATYPMDEQTC